MSKFSILPLSKIARFGLVVIYLLIASHFAAVSAIGQTSDNLKVVDLATDTSFEAIAQAHAGFQAGNAILRVTKGTPEDIRQLIGAALPNADVTTVDHRRSYTCDCWSHKSTEVTPARRGCLQRQER